MESTRVAVLTGPLRPREDESTPVGDAAGAVVTFLGVVRGEEGGTPIAGLEYSAYEPMATHVLEHLACETIERFGVLRVDVEHSRGLVPTGQCSFRLTISGAHRRETLDTMDWYIERMKQDAPIWKRAVAQTESHAADIAKAIDG